MQWIEKSSFLMYTEYLKHVQKLSMEQRGMLFTAILSYASAGTMPELDAATDMIFGVIQERMDRDYEVYMDKVEKRREAGKLGGRPKANGFSEKQEKAKKANGFSEKQNNPVTDTVTDTVTDIKKESKEKSSRFSPPTRQDVSEYCREKGYSNVDVDRFIDFYSCKGWMVGKNKMKDWKAAVRNWARSEKATKPNNTSGNKFNNFSQRQYDYDDLERQLLNSNPVN